MELKTIMWELSHPKSAYIIPPVLGHKNMAFAHYGGFLENVLAQKNYCIFQGFIYLCFMYNVYKKVKN